MTKTTASLVFAAICVAAAPVSGQALGTFRWNTAPYCNVLALAVTQVGPGMFTLDGYDEQCGGNPRQPAQRVAVLKPDGGVVIGLTIVRTVGPPVPVGLRAFISPSTLGGTWSDSATSSGTFVFNPGATTGGPRP